MKQIASALRRVAAAAAFAAALTGCARQEYAMLPKTSSYHGDTHRTVAKAQPAATEAVAVEEAAPVATPETPAVAPAPAAPATVAAAPVAEPVAAPAPAARAAKAEAAPKKLNAVQKLMVTKVAKKLDKALAKAPVVGKKHHNDADAKALDGNIRKGLILLLIGILIEIVAAAIGSSLIYVLGAIVALVGLVLIVVGLLDMV